MNNTPETDELDRSLKNKYTPVLDCYYKMKIHSCRLEIDRDEQCRLLGMSAERECDLRGKIERLEHECYSIQSKLSDAEAEIEEIQEQLNAYIMLDKMAMRKFIREQELEQLKQQQP